MADTGNNRKIAKNGKNSGNFNFKRKFTKQL